MSSDILYNSKEYFENLTSEQFVELLDEFEFDYGNMIGDKGGKFVMQIRYIKYELKDSEEPYDKINKILTEFMALGIEAKLFKLTETYIVFAVKLSVKNINLTDYLRALGLTDSELDYLVESKLLGVRTNGATPLYFLKDSDELTITRFKNYLNDIGKLKLVYVTGTINKINL